MSSEAVRSSPGPGWGCAAGRTGAGCAGCECGHVCAYACNNISGCKCSPHTLSGAHGRTFSRHIYFRTRTRTHGRAYVRAPIRHIAVICYTLQAHSRAHGRPCKMRAIAGRVCVRVCVRVSECEGNHIICRRKLSETTIVEM